jgi:hypothetical protein
MLGTWLYNSAASALDSSVYAYNTGNQRTSLTRNVENTADYYRYDDPNLQRWLNTDPFLEPGFETVSHVSRRRSPSSYSSLAEEHALPRFSATNPYGVAGNTGNTSWDIFGSIFSLDPCQRAKDALDRAVEKALAEQESTGDITPATLAAMDEAAAEVVANCPKDQDEPPTDTTDDWCPDPSPRFPPMDPNQNNQSFCQNHPTVCHVGIGVGIGVAVGVGILILAGSGGTAAPVLGTLVTAL